MRFDACTPRYNKRDRKTWWHKVGSAWQNDKGMITVYLDSIPLPDPDKDNKAVIMLFEPREREAAATGGQPNGGDQRSNNLDDDIPF